VRTITAQQRAWLANASHVTHVRATFEDPDGDMVELTNIFGVNWLKRVRVAEDQDTPVGTATLVLLRYDAATNVSMSPEIGGSPINRTGAGDYAPFIALGRRVRVRVCVMPRGFVPNDGDFVPIFDGRAAQIGGEGTDWITVTCQDLGGDLQRAWIKEKTVYGDPAGLPFESVAANVLEDWMLAPPSIYLPVPIDKQVGAWEQDKANVLEALRTIALETGHDFRYRFDGAHVSRLTYLAPNRDAVVPVDWLPASAFIDKQAIEQDIASIRNSITVRWWEGEGEEAEQKSVDRVDAVSVAAYRGEQWMEFSLGAGSPINTEAEAIDLAEAALHDTAIPPADHVLDALLLWHVQLGDLLGLRADGVLYDSDQTMGVAAYEHTIENGEGRTSLTLRGRVTGAFREWLRRGGGGIGGKPGEGTGALRLRNFRQLNEDSDKVDFGWDADTRIAEIHVWEKDVPSKTVVAKGLDELWPIRDAEGKLPPPTLRLTGDTVEYTRKRPKLGDIASAQLIPFDKDGKGGNPQRVRVLPAGETPVVFGLRHTPGATGLFTDIVIEFNDPQGHGGTLYAWVNRSDPADANPLGPYDGRAVFATTPNLAGPSTDFTPPSGVGLEKVLDNVRVHAGRGKRVFFEFVNTEGISSGVTAFVVLADGGVIDENGEIRDAGIKRAEQFAATIQPVRVYDDPSELPAGAPEGAFAVVAGVLWKKTAAGWEKAITAANLEGVLTGEQLGNAIISTAKFAAGIRPVELLASPLPTPPGAGRVALNTTDGKLYRSNAAGTAWDPVGATTFAELSGTVAGVQIALGAITEDLLAANAVTSTKILDGAISTPKILAGAVVADSIGANAVTAAKILAGAVIAEKIAAGAVVAGKIDTDAVTANTIAASAVIFGKIAAGAVRATEIFAGAVSTDHLAAGAVTAVKIAAGTITGDRIAGRTIDAGRLVANTITSDEIASNSIIAGKIAAGAINASALIVDGVITAVKLAVTLLSEVSANAGIIVSGVLQNVSGSNFINLNATGSQEFLRVGTGISAYADGSAIFRGEVASSSFTTPAAVFSGSARFYGLATVRGVDGSGAVLRIADYQSFSGIEIIRGTLSATVGAVALASNADLDLTAIGGGLGEVRIASGGTTKLRTGDIPVGEGVVSGVWIAVREDAGTLGERLIYVDGPNTAGAGWRQLRVKNNP
jgi:hypothetical protein